MYEACNKLIKQTLKKVFDTKSDPNIALLQIRSTPLGPGLLSPTTLLFNCPIRGIMAIINRPPISLNNDNKHYEALFKRQMKNYMNHDTLRNYASIPIGSTVVVQCKDGGHWTHGAIEGKGDHNHNDRSYTI